MTIRLWQHLKYFERSLNTTSNVKSLCSRDYLIDLRVPFTLLCGSDFFVFISLVLELFGKTQLFALCLLDLVQVSDFLLKLYIQILRRFVRNIANIYAYYYRKIHAATCTQPLISCCVLDTRHSSTRRRQRCSLIRKTTVSCAWPSSILDGNCTVWAKQRYVHGCAYGWNTRLV